MLKEGIPTASGKFELYSLEIEKLRKEDPDCGLDPLPTYRKPFEENERE